MNAMIPPFNASLVCQDACSLLWNVWLVVNGQRNGLYAIRPLWLRTEHCLVLQLMDASLPVAHLGVADPACVQGGVAQHAQHDGAATVAAVDCGSCGRIHLDKPCATRAVLVSNHARQPWCMASWGVSSPTCTATAAGSWARMCADTRCPVVVLAPSIVPRRPRTVRSMPIHDPPHDVGGWPSIPGSLPCHEPAVLVGFGGVHVLADPGQGCNGALQRALQIESSTLSHCVWLRALHGGGVGVTTVPGGVSTGVCVMPARTCTSNVAVTVFCVVCAAWQWWAWCQTLRNLGVSGGAWGGDVQWCMVGVSCLPVGLSFPQAHAFFPARALVYRLRH